jgi:hypothetical protein
LRVHVKVAPEMLAVEALLFMEGAVSLVEDSLCLMPKVLINTSTLFSQRKSLPCHLLSCLNTIAVL